VDVTIAIQMVTWRSV